MHSFLTSNLDRYAVIGNPIIHSKSPFIHALFAEQTGENIIYEYRLAPIGGFEENVREFIAEGGRGANVTVPFKINAYVLSDTLSERAEAAGAVNTLRFDDGYIFGDNTDGIGLVRDIELHFGVSLSGIRILILGAGGAARGVIKPILDRTPKSITIINRTRRKAQTLVLQFSEAARNAGCILSGGGPEDMVCAEPYDVIINATSCSLNSKIPDCDIRAFGKTSLAYDMMYGKQSTVFTRYAASLGARVADGIGMLVEQAAESFKIWRSIQPESTSVLAELSKHVRGLSL
ncbi:MAG: shikimate dehydrogenase [Burkholderia sp.]|nr:shikimate dehydrogenase [Burkholderia sp.]